MKKIESVQFDYPYTLYDYYIPEEYKNCTLNNFDFGTRKSNLIQSVKNFVEGIGSKRGLYFYGSFGVGKTHLLVALYRVVVSQENDSSPNMVYYTSFERVVREVKISSDEEYLDILFECEWLFLDDISVVNLKKDNSSEILRSVINHRYESKLPTCFTSNLNLEKLEQSGLHPHAISRINSMCEILEIKGRDRRREG